MQVKLLLKLEEAMQSGERFTWIKPWKGAPYPCSYNYPEKPFSSPINLLFLEAGEYLTYQQICSHPSAKIKKGAKQEIVFQRFPVFQKDEAFRNNLAYLQHWHGHIKAARPKEIYFAVASAKEAAELILDSCPVVKQLLEPKILQLDELEPCRETTGKEVLPDVTGRAGKTL